MLVPRLVVVSLVLAAASAFLRSGIDCEETRPVEFGYDLFTTCKFLASNCSSLREKIVESIEEVISDLERLDDGTGNNIYLIKQPWDGLGEEDNSTDEMCRVPVGVQLKVVYNAVSAAGDRFSIVGASMGVEEGITREHMDVKLSWSVLFREVKPKSNVSRWWEQMNSREGSSYNLLWAWDGLTTEGPPPGQYLFSLGMAVIVCLIVLSPYY